MQTPFWTSAVSLLTVFLLPGTAMRAARSDSLPDIVVYLSDDHSQYDSSLYGAADIPTPQFEKLASEGMVLTHAFVASPSCAPSRAALLTGLMPARNGAEDNHSWPREGVASLAPKLAKLGYQVAAFGKVAHSRKNPRFGFDPTGTHADYPAIREEVAAFLAKRDAKKPLCLFVGISNPHVPWPYETSFDPAEVRLPPTFLDTPKTRQLRAMYYQEIKELDHYLGELRVAAGKHLGKNVLFIHTSDHGSQWPFGKWTLYDYGTRVPFIATWPGKIEPGSRNGAMVSWIDLLPTLIDIAGGEAPSGIDGRSFAPVLLGKEDSHRDRIFTTHSGDRGMNVYPIRSVRTRDWKLIHNLHPEFAFTTHTTLLGRPDAGAYWKEWASLSKTDARARSIVGRFYKRPEFELYRVSTDKWEQENLAEAPAQADVRNALKRELSDWMKSQSDKRGIFSDPRPLENLETWHPDHVKPVPMRKRKKKP